ncbi:MAG: (d)CMP kinase [Bdellovibrionales bacterium]
MTNTLIIAVDGLAATGKGTLARRIAAELDFAYLDTGLLYRAVGHALLVSGKDPADPKAAVAAAKMLGMTESADPELLRSDEVGQAASKASVIPEVRSSLLKFQQDFAASPPDGKKGAVLDGRDIGTVIAPHAPIKIFVTARPEIRAHRRFLELQERGENVTEATILADMEARDKRDQERAIAPAVPAEDAVILDTSSLDRDEVFRKALLIVEEKLKLLEDTQDKL